MDLHVEPDTLILHLNYMPDLQSIHKEIVYIGETPEKKNFFFTPVIGSSNLRQEIIHSTDELQMFLVC